MTCKLELGSAWQGQESTGLLCKAVKTFQVGNTQIEITTGGMNQPTKINVIGKHLDHFIAGKVKEWSSAKVDQGFNLYGNGAIVSLSSPEDPYHLEVTNLPKGKV